MEFKHISVLLEECIDALNIKEDGIYVDCTLGGAGHSSEIIKRLSSKGTLIGIDQDTDALKAAKERLKEYENVIYVHDNFHNIEEILKNYYSMIEEREYDRELLGEACVYDDIYKQPSRKTCVTLFARGMEKVIREEK